MRKDARDKLWDEIKKYRKLFKSFEFRGKVLSYASSLDNYLGRALTQYFIRDDKYSEGLRLISSLNFDKKIQIFEHVPIRKKENHKKAVLGLRVFQRVRNIAAHSHFVFAKDLQNLLRDRRALIALSNYPNNMDALFVQTQISIVELMQTKAFQNKMLKNSY
jgi:hypothetical protein